MLQDTTRARAPVPLPPLLGELWRLLAAHRPAVGQARCFDRLRALVGGHLCTAARQTLTQGLRALGLSAQRCRLERLRPPTASSAGRAWTTAR
jgi:hypothetical protein